MRDQLAGGGGRCRAVWEEFTGARELTLSKEAGMSMSVTDESWSHAGPGAQGSLGFNAFKYILYSLPFPFFLFCSFSFHQLIL